MTQRARLSEYAKVKLNWAKDNRVCVKCGAKAEKDPHHSRGRLGSLLCDTRFFKALCFRCHDWVHNNMQEARELGLLCPRGQWNTPER